MFTLQLVFVFLIFHIFMNFGVYVDGERLKTWEKEPDNHYDDSTKYENDHTDKIPQQTDAFDYDKCDASLSIVRPSDIIYFIEKKVEALNFEQNFRSSFCVGAQNVYDKYMCELEDFKCQLKNRPDHTLHILSDMTDTRRKLEPEVESIVTQLEEYTDLESSYNRVAGRAQQLLNQFENIKQLCEINCESDSFTNSFAPLSLKSESSSETAYCIKLDDLLGYIDEQLNLSTVQVNEYLNQELELKNTTYAGKTKEFKQNLKEAAVKQFGMTMYDILSLQDDYFHFAEKLRQVNIHSELYDIEQNIAGIKLATNKLKKDMKKYHKYCSTCNNVRMKRSNHQYHDVNRYLNELLSIDTRAYFNAEELIKTKIDEIKETLIVNCTKMFENLDVVFENSTSVIETYVSQLEPIRSEIGNKINQERQAFEELTERLSEETLDNIFQLSKISSSMLQNVTDAKDYINDSI